MLFTPNVVQLLLSHCESDYSFPLLLALKHCIYTQKLFIYITILNIYIIYTYINTYIIWYALYGVFYNYISVKVVIDVTICLDEENGPDPH